MEINKVLLVHPDWRWSHPYTTLPAVRWQVVGFPKGGSFEPFRPEFFLPGKKFRSCEMLSKTNVLEGNILVLCFFCCKKFRSFNASDQFSVLSYQFSTPLLLNIKSWSFSLHPSFPTSVSSSLIWSSFNPTALFWMMKREFSWISQSGFLENFYFDSYRHPQKKNGAHVLSSKAS